MTLDARALLIVGAFLCWILALAIEFLAIRPDAKRWLPGAYTSGLLIHGVGLLLVSQRGLIGDFWSILVANVLLLLAPLFYFSALQAVRGLKADYRILAAIPVSVAVLLPLVGFSQQAFAARVLIFTGAATFALGLICWSAFRLAREGKAGGWMVLGAIGTLAVLTVARAVSVAAGQVSGVNDSQGIQLAFYLVNDACVALAAFGYMDMIRSRAQTLVERPSEMAPDPQTGLYSRAAFLRSGMEELSRARRKDYPITLMLIQIDRIDAIAAAKGAGFVELALGRVAASILRDIRMYDVAGRLSESVMGVIMPELAQADAVAVGERIRSAIAEDPAICSGVYGVTVSAGVCEVQGIHRELGEVIAVAHQCLERARALGGNRVVTPDPSLSKSFVQDTI